MKPFFLQAPFFFFLQAPFCLLKINLISMQFHSSLSHPKVVPSYITYADLPISTFGYSASYCWNVLFVKINSDLKQ